LDLYENLCDAVVIPLILGIEPQWLEENAKSDSPAVFSECRVAICVAEDWMIAQGA
jgi:hypothetical protein